MGLIRGFTVAENPQNILVKPISAKSCQVVKESHLVLRRFYLLFFRIASQTIQQIHNISKEIITEGQTLEKAIYEFKNQEKC